MVFGDHRRRQDEDVGREGGRRRIVSEGSGGILAALRAGAASSTEQTHPHGEGDTQEGTSTSGSASTNARARARWSILESLVKFARR